MNWPTWICQTEHTTITIWLCKVLITTTDQTHVLVVGPRLDSELNLVQSARTVAETYVQYSTLFLVDYRGQIIPRANVTDIMFLDKPIPRQYQRRRIFRWFTTSWKKLTPS